MKNGKSRKRKPICSVVFDRESGMIIRILRSTDACSSWVKKHFPGESRPISPMYSRTQVLNEFDNQMQVGLTDEFIIDQLLYFGGVYGGEVSRKVKGLE